MRKAFSMFSELRVAVGGAAMGLILATALAAPAAAEPDVSESPSRSATERTVPSTSPGSRAPSSDPATTPEPKKVQISYDDDGCGDTVRVTIKNPNPFKVVVAAFQWWTPVIEPFIPEPSIKFTVEIPSFGTARGDLSRADVTDNSGVYLSNTVSFLQNTDTIYFPYPPSTGPRQDFAKQLVYQMDLRSPTACRTPPPGSTPPSSPGLPVTGVDVGLLAGSAMVFVAIGTGLYLIARHRRVHFTP